MIITISIVLLVFQANAGNLSSFPRRSTKDGLSEKICLLSRKLVGGSYPCACTSNSLHSWWKLWGSVYLATVAIMLSLATLITLIGRHLKLAKYNINVTMFYKILETFATFLLWYSFFLIAFSLGFYIMLHKDLPSRNLWKMNTSSLTTPGCLL